MRDGWKLEKKKSTQGYLQRKEALNKKTTVQA